MMSCAWHNKSQLVKVLVVQVSKDMAHLKGSTHRCVSTHACIRTHMCTHCTRVHTHAHTHSHTHAHAHAHTHMCRHTHRDTYRHTHRYTAHTWYLVVVHCKEFCNSRVLGFLILNQQQVNSSTKVLMSCQLNHPFFRNFNHGYTEMFQVSKNVNSTRNSSTEDHCLQSLHN